MDGWLYQIKQFICWKYFIIDWISPWIILFVADHEHWRLFGLFLGKEIKEDLVQLLQKRLDEAVLEIICEMLRRNPQCQLDKHDVQVSRYWPSEAQSSFSSCCHVISVWSFNTIGCLDNLHLSIYSTNNKKKLRLSLWPHSFHGKWSVVSVVLLTF